MSDPQRLLQEAHEQKGKGRFSKAADLCQQALDIFDLRKDPDLHLTAAAHLIRADAKADEAVMETQGFKRVGAISFPRAAVKIKVELYKQAIFHYDKGIEILDELVASGRSEQTDDVAAAKDHRELAQTRLRELESLPF